MRADLAVRSVRRLKVWRWDIGSNFARNRVRRQRAPFHRLLALGRRALMLGAHGLPCSGGRLVGFGARIVVSDLESNLPRILAAAGQSLPYVVLASSSNDDALEIDPSLSDEVRLLVVGEDGDLELIIIGRVVHCKSQLLVPAETQSASAPSVSCLARPESIG